MCVLDKSKDLSDMKELHPVICVKLALLQHSSLIYNMYSADRESEVCSFFKYCVTFYPQRVPSQC
jgi:hypothetical protein